MDRWWHVVVFDEQQRQGHGARVVRLEFHHFPPQAPSRIRDPCALELQQTTPETRPVVRYVQSSLGVEEARIVKCRQPHRRDESKRHAIRKVSVRWRFGVCLGMTFDVFDERHKLRVRFVSREGEVQRVSPSQQCNAALAGRHLHTHGRHRNGFSTTQREPFQPVDDNLAKIHVLKSVPMGL